MAKDSGSLSSLEYWKKREREAQEKYKLSDEEAEKRIHTAYYSLLSSINDRINGFYSRYASSEGITMALAEMAVSQMDVKAYESRAAKLVKDKDFSPKANQELKLYNATMRINRLEMLKSNIGLDLIEYYNDIEYVTERHLTDRAQAEFERQAGILGQSIHPVRKDLENIVNASFHNASFSERIWANQKSMRDSLSTLLTNALVQGRGSRELAKDLSRQFEVSYANALRLLRTEEARVQTEAQKQSFEKCGYDQYVFISLEGRACSHCSALDTGEPIPVKDMQPGLNAPPMHPNCRCSTAAYMDREAVEREVFGENENEISPLYRKGYTNRKVAKDGHEIIDKALYNKLVKKAIKSGADIRRPTPEILARMDKMDASAVTYGSVIYFRDDATVSDVLEEIFHFYQNKRNSNGQYGIRQRIVMNEIEAKKYLLDVAEKYHIPDSEIELTKNQLMSYIKEKEELKERGEWND